jgi:bleomycin hydrolase
MHATRVLTKPEQAQSDDGTLSAELLDEFASQFAANPAGQQAQNAVTQVSIEDVALDHAVAIGITPTFSTVLDDWTVTNQKRTGRCWMFAGLNLLRVGAEKAMNLRDFEYSQNYTLFWDNVERAN